ncbi:MAG: bifunctional metallophosphatase/5'-nucleotidase [Bacteroidetes bacterium GWC2_33_15]|nr:MAG: bifunctional metallophosphatase/5'-nucleotidase [Bacteroidetes bacterium GWA2_33_15]OFX52176.1 MAG: bifunctional metallophosphatase/5'-nucleotidase [Bacteroidetes bacterium GWC2_33_15]OFX64330.1 MAG: bifunctional metallophosphatase/5'-nucleotidase [Bacteroidetes bacterium GWB2_32_14]OFX67735.1 MAG: bifunctional metallophosphatase/5'-nucleotidase [Bacteroidetes bacterium GWD2_33_33]HAN19346.1 bifunctional metallophosphatase/5'-nucleotidase [Bacteroidales bacterium]
MKKRILTGFILLFSILHFICYSQNKPAGYILKIVETSDVHGALYNYDFINDTKAKTSLAQVETYIKSQKTNQDIVLMDNGDIIQGQPVVYYSNYKNTSDTHIVAKMLNYMNYDVATIGNHDIEAGHAVYDKLVNEYKFPLLAANAIRTDNGKPYFKPYTVINRKGYKIAVLGLITPGIPDWLPQELWQGIEFEDMIESAKKWVPIILENEKPDLMIGLFHAGFDFTYSNSDENTFKNENASVLVAKQVPGFDIIFIGHDHRMWNEKIKNSMGKDVFILGPQGSSRQVTAATINFSTNEKGQTEKTIKTEIVEISNYKPDSIFINQFKKEFAEVKDYVSRPIGQFEKTILTNDAIFGPSIFIELIHQIQLDITHADISFTAPLSYNDTIKKGVVYVRDMFKLYRFENFLYTMNLTGTEIKNYLEYSYNSWFNTMKDENDHILIFKSDSVGNPVYNEKNKSYTLKNNFYNFDVAAGISYIVDVSKPFNQKISINSMSNGEPFYADSVYTVAINSYRGNGGGGLLTYGAGLDKEEITKRRMSSTDKDFRFYIMQWIEKNKIINPDFNPGWYVIPELWWGKAVVKDKKMLNVK